MRILCLHGAGTNSRIFEIQIAALRYELGDNHDYDFVEGTIPWKMYPGVERIALKDEPVYAFFDPENPDTGRQAFAHLQNYLRDEGPYDGVIAFSQAATMVLTYLVYIAEQRTMGISIDTPFKFAVLMSIVQPPIDYGALENGTVEDASLERLKGIVDSPTAHIWGALDVEPKGAAKASEFCREDVRWTYVHERGHEVPGYGSRVDVTRAVNVIRRAVESAT
ncbi:uncharacterized protein BDW47DRAFT_97488 [Aspergillus candidus]|uniref:Serine hydrolase FSH n=1 Tax=Aspergillus candidus TaxID=41067 RepID=A0A2I2FPR6_ASPCN|nr:serine hydrolase FSH [Aspergillus candidus]PLB42609.1 serine hydrolase FSH [Aspergillus candidus]